MAFRNISLICFLASVVSWYLDNNNTAGGMLIVSFYFILVQIGENTISEEKKDEDLKNNP